MRNRTRAALAAVALLAAGGGLSTLNSEPALPPAEKPRSVPRPTGGSVLVPSTIAADCSRYVDSDLNAFIRTVPNNSTIVFPSGGCYLAANRIEVRDKDTVTVDGSGSTFKTTANGVTTQAVNGNWVLIRGRGVVLKNMTAVGSFDLPGPRSLATESTYTDGPKKGQPRAEYTEATMNYGVYGTQGAWLIDVKGHNAWGDAVTLGPAHYVDPNHVGSHDYADDVHVLRMEARKTSRHCWAATSGVGFWLEDSTCTDAWYAGLDSELDGVDQELKNHHYLRNTFDGYHLGGFLIPVPGERDKVDGIEIRGNRFLTTPDVVCNPTLLVGGYPDIGPDYEFKNVVVADNEISAYTRAITLDHVNGGVVSGNKITTIPPPNGGKIEHFCGANPGQIVVTNSRDIKYEESAPTTTTTTTAPTTTTTTAAPQTTTTSPAPTTSTTRPPTTTTTQPPAADCLRIFNRDGESLCIQ